MLEAARNKHIVAPGINWLVATLHDAKAVSTEKTWLQSSVLSVISSDTRTRRPSRSDTRRSWKRQSEACERCIGAAS